MSGKKISLFALLKLFGFISVMDRCLFKIVVTEGMRGPNSKQDMHAWFAE